VRKKTAETLDNFTGMEKEDRDLLIETRNNKMDFEMKKNCDITQMHKEEIDIEKESLFLEKDNLTMKKGILWYKYIGKKTVGNGQT
jgi:hypothetical protein